MGVVLFLAIWFGSGVLTSPLVYKRFRARHARTYPMLEMTEGGHGYALEMALTSIAMGALALPFTLVWTHGTGWRA